MVECHHDSVNIRRRLRRRGRKMSKEDDDEQLRETLFKVELAILVKQ